MPCTTPQNILQSITGNIQTFHSNTKKDSHFQTTKMFVGWISQPALQCKWCTNCPEGACISSSVSCTSEHDCRINQREIFLSSNCTETSCEASDCPKCTASGKCMWTRQFKRTGMGKSVTEPWGKINFLKGLFIFFSVCSFGCLYVISHEVFHVCVVIFLGETRRILSVNPTYDWTCFSYALLNVSPMQVESSPPMPCPPPCHSLHNCSLCLGSRGSDGGWQHCVWSMALQQVRLSGLIYFVRAIRWNHVHYTANFSPSPLVHEPVFRASAMWGGSVWSPALWGRLLLSPVLPAHPVLPVHQQASVWLVCSSRRQRGWTLPSRRTWWWQISSVDESKSWAL